MESLTTAAAASVDVSVGSSLLVHPGSYSEYYHEECSRQWDTNMAFTDSLSYALENSLKIWQVSRTKLHIKITCNSLTQPASYGSRPSGRTNTDRPDSRLGAALDFSWSLDLAKGNCRGERRVVKNT